MRCCRWFTGNVWPVRVRVDVYHLKSRICALAATSPDTFAIFTDCWSSSADCWSSSELASMLRSCSPFSLLAYALAQRYWLQTCACGHVSLQYLLLRTHPKSLMWWWCLSVQQLWEDWSTTRKCDCVQTVEIRGEDHQQSFNNAQYWDSCAIRTNISERMALIAKP